VNTIEFDRTPQVGDIVFCKIFAESSGYCDDPEVCEVWSVHESVNDDLFLVYVMSLINNNLSNVLYWNTAKNDWDDDQKCSETDRARLVINAGANTMHTDGNTTALNQYQREQDALEDQDEALRVAQQELSNDLFDGYFEGKSACVDWIDEVILDDEDTANNLLDKMRAQYLKPLAGLRAAYSLIIIDVCDTLAAQQKTHEDVERERHECGL
jgi:hypothetical protein